ncbi:hypothetical protein GCK72_012921 [Caenorhabditis remanei]|uniref:CUT domain-containing protein n=1 Tax=Caenorhabditis remanei TaxID=31234 RepID=A0A6A5GM85_CAERE|nr:hypothetical protein GCK72_012921 [Caenorhabditis remanei]KAF1756468.1 hypothetical protein GCK72_012921 [Caenorhabditis remanei]
MIPTRALTFQQIIDESTYILTELTNVRHPMNTDCYGILKRKEVPISCFELDTVQIENRFRTECESRDHPICFGILDENQYTNKFEPATKRMKLEDSSVDQETSVGSCSLPERGVTRELNNAVLNSNRPMPSSSPEFTFTPVSSSLSSPTSTQSHSMSIKQAQDLLSTPISYKINLDTKEIASQMRKWFTLAICSQAFFAVHVLGVVRSRFHRVLTIPPPFNSLKAGKELYIKMYNWLNLSEDVKKEILSVSGTNSIKFAQESVNEEEEYECPKEISRKRKASFHSETSSYSSSSLSSDSFLYTSITTETFNALINKPVTYVNTSKISFLVKDWLEETQATQEWFATKILKRCRRTLSQCLNNPKDWKDLSQKREIYVKMHNWMCLTKEQRHEMMRAYNAPNMDSH